jgi:type II secretory pathway pseudopilin PulG
MTFSVPRHRSQRGMTLIEIMVAFGILVVGLVSIFAMLNAAMRSHKRAMNETEAAIVAESVLADLRSEFQRGRIVRSDGKGLFDISPDFPDYSVRKTIIPLEPARKGVAGVGGDREFFVRIEVRWSSEGDNKSVHVDSVLFCNEEKKLDRRP